MEYQIITIFKLESNNDFGFTTLNSSHTGFSIVGNKDDDKYVAKVIKKKKVVSENKIKKGDLETILKRENRDYILKQYKSKTKDNIFVVELISVINKDDDKSMMYHLVKNNITVKYVYIEQLKTLNYLLKMANDFSEPIDRIPKDIVDISEVTKDQLIKFLDKPDNKIIKENFINVVRKHKNMSRHQSDTTRHSFERLTKRALKNI
jgi:hypothetical protein